MNFRMIKVRGRKVAIFSNKFKGLFISGLIVLNFLLSSCSFLQVSQKSNPKLAPFATKDGCSFFVEEIGDANFAHCCFVHDLIYWLGGDEESRERADDELKSCVAKDAGDVLASAMWAAVRAGGTPYEQTDFRWTFGFPYNTRDYLPLTRRQKDQALRLKKSVYSTFDKFKNKIDPSHTGWVQRKIELFFKSLERL